jgi:hypothetical protein
MGSESSHENSSCCGRIGVVSTNEGTTDSTGRLGLAVAA